VSNPHSGSSGVLAVDGVSFIHPQQKFYTEFIVNRKIPLYNEVKAGLGKWQFVITVHELSITC
jgi:hypothetical protein